MDLSDRLRRIQDKVLSCNVMHDVKMLCVSKGQPLEKIQEAADLGMSCFGENYLQEALMKQKVLSQKLEWHFIGRIQRNKISKILDHFSYVHSVSRLDLLECFHKASFKRKAVMPSILIQFNLDKEHTKQGFFAEDLSNVVDSVVKYSSVPVQGLMFFPSRVDSETEGRERYARAYKIFKEFQGRLPKPLRERFYILSMGTSHDFVWAIKEGANLVRLGEIFFGPRNPIESIKF